MFTRNSVGVKIPSYLTTYIKSMSNNLSMIKDSCNATYNLRIMLIFAFRYTLGRLPMQINSFGNDLAFPFSKCRDMSS